MTAPLSEAQALKGNIQEFLRFMGNSNKGVYSEIFLYVSRRGRFSTKTKSYRGLCPRGKANRCLANSQREAWQADSILAYYEGWALPTGGIMPTLHAWLVHKGSIIDPTWEDRVKSDSLIGYLGVHVPASFIRTQMVTTQVYEPLLPAYLASSGKISSDART